MSVAITYRSGCRVSARRLILTAAAAAISSTLSLSGRLEAATKTWTNGSGTGVWSDAGNWSPTGVPANPLPAGDDLTFNGLTSPAATADAAWTVSTLNFKSNNRNTPFTLSGSPLTITGGINTDSRIRPTIENALTLAGTDSGPGLEVRFGFVAPGDSTGYLYVTGPVNGPARIRIANGGRVFFTQVPQNSGGPLASLDPGGTNYGLLLDDTFGIFAQRVSAPGTLTFFGNAATAIGMTNGIFTASNENFTGVATIPNPFRIITAGTNVATIESSSSVGGQHRLNLTGPMLLKGSLILSRTGSFSDTGVGGIGQELQGTITVAASNAGILDFDAPSDSLISGNITQDGTPRTLTLGHDGSLGATGILIPSFYGQGSVLRLSGDNTGLTGGIRVIGVTNAGDGSYSGPTRLAYRFLSLPSMGGGGNGNVFIGPNGTAGIGFALSDAALDKIDPTSSGVIGIDADSSLDIDLSAAGRNMPNVKLGTSSKSAQGPVHYTGHITPFGNTYEFAGPQSGGSLSIDGVNALSGARGLNAGDGMNLILSAPQSFTGPIHVGGLLTINASGAINPGAPIALDGGLAVANAAPAYSHNADITLGQTPNTFAGIRAMKTSSGAGYDLLLNGSLRGGGAQVQTGFDGIGTIVLNGPSNDFAGAATVGSTSPSGTTTLLVNSSLSASLSPLTLYYARLGGTGTILRPVTTQLFYNSILAPGGYPTPTGTLTIDSLQVAGASAPITYEFQFDAASHDFLKILHDFQNPVGGSAILKLLPLAGADALGQTFGFLDVDGAIPNAVAWTVDTSLAPQYAGSFVTFDPASATYSVTLAPEPTALGFWLAMPLLGRRRRHAGRVA